MNTKKIFAGFLLLGLLLFGSYKAIEVGTLYLVASSGTRHSSDLSLEEEKEIFTSSSSFDLPNEVELIDRSDSRGGFHGDGVYYLAFKTTEQTIEQYLQAELWERTWADEPISPVFFSVLTDLKNYREELSSSDTRFIFDRDMEDSYTSAGRLMVVMPSEKIVLYFEWAS